MVPFLVIVVLVINEWIEEGRGQCEYHPLNRKDLSLSLWMTYSCFGDDRCVCGAVPGDGGAGGDEEEANANTTSK